MQNSSLSKPKTKIIPKHQTKVTKLFIRKLGTETDGQKKMITNTGRLNKKVFKHGNRVSFQYVTILKFDNPCNMWH